VRPARVVHPGLSLMPMVRRRRCRLPFADRIASLRAEDPSGAGAVCEDLRNVVNLRTKNHGHAGHLISLYGYGRHDQFRHAGTQEAAGFPCRVRRSRDLWRAARPRLMTERRRRRCMPEQLSERFACRPPHACRFGMAAAPSGPAREIGLCRPSPRHFGSAVRATAPKPCAAARIASTVCSADL